jgi:Uma2 family endonuclease
MNVSDVLGAPMPYTEPPLQRLRMSWEEYLELPEKPKAEWVDGEVVVTPPVFAAHGYGVGGLVVALRSALPDLFVVTEVGVALPRNRLRAPDVMVIENWVDDAWVSEAPVLVVEVLSGSTRSEDTVRKSAEYAEGGIGQYWLLDPDLRCLDVFENVDRGWQPLLHLDDDHPAGDVVVADHGTVAIDVRTLLRPL